MCSLHTFLGLRSSRPGAVESQLPASKVGRILVCCGHTKVRVRGVYYSATRCGKPLKERGAQQLRRVRAPGAPLLQRLAAPRSRVIDSAHAYFCVAATNKNATYLRRRQLTFNRTGA